MFLFFVLSFQYLLFFGNFGATAVSLETDFCNKFVRINGYLCAEYAVTTLDGYILNLQNIALPPSPTQSPPPPPTPQSSLPPLPSLIQSIENATSATSPCSVGGANLTLPCPSPSSSPPPPPPPSPPPPPPPSPPPPPPPLSTTRPSVLLNHAVFLGGDVWFYGLTVEKQLPLYLTENGFDVWIANHRATEFSPKSNFYTTDDFAYWDFSFDQLAIYDLPKMIEFIQTVTGKPTIHYIGYNQGAMLPFAAIASNPSIASSFASIVSIGPIAFLGNITSPILYQWGNGFTPDTIFYEFGLLNGTYNLSNTVELESLLDLFGVDLMVQYGGGDDVTSIVSDVTGPNCCVSQSTLENIGAKMNNDWVVAPYRNLIQYQQEIRSGLFQYWDYINITENLAAYGVFNAPSYNLLKIPSTLPVFLVNGLQDWFADSPNIELLVQSLPLIPQRLTLPTYAHFDLMYSDSIVEDLYDYITEYLGSGYLGS